MLGQHVIKCWSATQASLALSSGEAEYYGVVRGTGVGLGQQALGRDAGFELPIRVWTDSSAAMGTASRQGLGKLRHLECHSLWIQQRLRRKEFELRKVLGTENPADLFTKHMDSAAKLDGLVARFGCRFQEGRPTAAPGLKKAKVSAGLVCGSPGHVLAVEAPLPHLLPEEVMNREHPCAEPESERLEEPDKTPMEELSDPLRRGRHKQAAGVCLPRSEPAGTTRAASRSSPTAARVVGECLHDGRAGHANRHRQAATRRRATLPTCCAVSGEPVDAGPSARRHRAILGRHRTRPSLLRSKGSGASVRLAGCAESLLHAEMPSERRPERAHYGIWPIAISRSDRAS